MKMSRRERKIFEAGKRAGFEVGFGAGYEKGLYDGNPFNAIVEATKTLAVTLNEKLKDPAFIEYLERQRDLFDDVLEIEEGKK